MKMAVFWYVFTNVSEALAAPIISPDDEGRKDCRNVVKLVPNDSHLHAISNLT
jgi:hypothetical protein